MTLGDIAAAMAHERASHWTIDGQAVLAVPYKLQRLKSGHYRLTVRTRDNDKHVLILSPYAKSILTHPLEYDLR